MTFSPGTKLGRYEIHSQLGVGGMGEVYLAQDTKLDRKVALKILPVEVAGDRDRMRRFVQEAKAASALNHPNIITIYEIEEIDSIHFISTEFIDGQTLRERIRKAPLKLHDVLDIFAQIASALSAAHAAGIVHRDIKTDNIMLRPDGVVKVLDFGLAKLIERPPDSIDTEAPTYTAVKTEAGIVMGTLMYMSPEQARGKSVDARTDIFSLGVVLYEAVTGRLPFDGSTSSEVLASILSEKEPQPLARYARDVPAELERIVEKALRKQPLERYQTSQDLLLDLKHLKEHVEFERKLERSLPSKSKSALEVGEQTRDPRETNSRLRPSLGVTGATTTINFRPLAIIVISLIIVASAAAIYLYSVRAGDRAINSVAVLPFVNTSNDPNMDYVSDGISEALINSLTELQQLRVIARSTVFRYKGKEVDPQTMGRELNVGALLMGRVRQIEDTLNIQVDLVDARTGAQLWGREYERKSSDVLSIKQSIAREATDRLRLRLTGDEQQRLTKRDTTNAEAYQFYLRGRHYWNKRSIEGMKRATEEFQQAIDRDPSYALGYVGLADCYLQLEQYAGVPSNEIVPKAIAAVDRALALDESLSEAHATSATIKQKMWRWAEAEQELKRAISLNPNYPTAHHWYAYYFYIKRQFDDAMKEIKKAYELDPLSPVISENVANVYLLKNDVNSAIEQCQRTIELDPGFADAHYILGFAYLTQRRVEEATTEFEKSVDLSGRAGTYLCNLGYCYAVTGRQAEAISILKELEQKYAQGKSSGLFLAAVYAGLGDKNKAFVWLEKDFQQRSGQLPTISWRLHFEGLRSDPRYAELLRRMGLEP